MSHEFAIKISVPGAGQAVAEVGKVEHSFDGVEQAAKAAATAATDAFKNNSMASAVQAEAGKIAQSFSGIEHAAKAAAQASAEAFRRSSISSVAQAEADKVAEAFRTMGLRTSREIADEARKIRDAYKSLSLGDLSSGDMDRATGAMKTRFAELRSEMDKVNGRNPLPSLEISARQTAAALRGVPAQFTDIVTSLAAGQAPLTVFMQQGGQLKDMFGGAGNAARALGGYVMGLVNPFTAAAAGAGLFAVAAYQGSKESKALQDAIILTGNAAGATGSQLRAMSTEVAQSANTTKGAAVAALEQAVSGGKVAAQNLAMVAESAIMMERAAGKAIEETVKDFSELGKAPVAASLKLNEQYNYLTAAIYQQIKALDDQGRSSEAASLAQKTYAEAMDQRSKEVVANLGDLEKAWNSLGRAGKWAWDQMKNAGREESFDQQIATLKKQLSTGSFDFALTESDIKAQISSLEALIAADKRRTEEKTKQNATDKASIALAVEAEKYATKAEQKQVALNQAVAHYTTAISGAVGNQQQMLEEAKNYEKVVAGIREKFSEKGGSNKAAITDALQGFKALIAGEVDAAKDGASQQLSALKDLHASGLVSWATYYDQVAAIQEAALRQEIEAYGKGLSAAMARGDKSEIQVYANKIANAGRSIQKAWEDAADGTAKAQFDIRKKTIDSLVQEAGALENKATQLQAEAEQYGLTTQQIYAAAAARVQERIEMNSFGDANDDVIAALRRQKKAYEDLSKAAGTIDANKQAEAAAKDASRAWEKFSDDIERGLTDSIFRAFESGKDPLDAFAESVKNTFKTMALKLGVQYTVNGAGQLVGALGNAALNGLAGTSENNGGAGNNYIGTASNISSLYNAYNTASGYYAAYQTGTTLSSADAAAAAAAYYQSGYFGTGAALQTGSYLGSATAASTATSTANTAAALDAYYAANGISTAATGSAVAAEVGGTAAAEGAGSLAGLSSTGYGAIIAAVILFLKLASQQKTRYLGSSVSGSYVDGKFAGNLADEYKTTSSLFTQGSRSVDLTPISNNPADFEPLRQAYIENATRWWEQARDQAINQAESDGAPENFGSRLMPDDPKVALTHFDEMVASSIGKTSGIKTALDFLYESVKGGLIHAGETLWDTSFTDKLKGFTKDIQISNISDFGASMEAVGASLSESMAAITLPTVNELKKTGETWSQSFGRLMSEANAVARISEMMGKSLKDVFGENNANAILRFSDSMVSVFGDIEKLNQSFGSYYSNFYTQEEQQASTRKDMTKAMEALGQVMPTTRAGFRALVDAAYQAGDAKLYKNLLDLSEGFAAITPAVTAALAAIDTAGRKTWGDKLAILDGSTTARAIDLSNALAGTTDDEVKRLISRVFELEDAATSAAAATDALTRANTAAAENAARLAEVVRSAALASFDASRSALQSFASAGVANITEVVNLEKQRIGVIRSVAAESVTSIKSVFSTLTTQIDALYGSVSSTREAQATEGSVFIANALANAQATGYLPDRDALSSAISAARTGLDASNFATQFEADRAALVMAGQLSQLKDIASTQLPAAEQAVKIADDQLKALDDSLEYYKKQLNQLLGINDNTLNFTGTIEQVGAAIVSQLAGMSASLSSSIIAALKGGSITAADAAGQLKTSGVATDVATTVAGSNAFVSAQGASIVDGMVYATNGFKGSLTEAKDEVLKAFNTLPPRDFRAAAISVGLSAAMIDQMFSLPVGHSNRWALENGLPQFAVGTNYVPKDMIGLIHEGEAIVPKAYNPAAGANGRLERLVEGLTGEVQRLQLIVDTGNLHAARTANAVNGYPESPMLVETV